MNKQGNGFVPLDRFRDEQGRVRFPDGGAPPVFTVGQTLVIEDVRFEVVRVAKIPPRLVLKPVGRVGVGP